MARPSAIAADRFDRRREQTGQTATGEGTLEELRPAPNVAHPPAPDMARPVCVYIEGIAFLLSFFSFLSP
jgi:hypothetical protein